MPRRHSQSYNSAALEELASQLLFSPAPKRIEQIRCAEKLHDEIEATANYPLDYIVYRLTRYRRAAGNDVLLVGEALGPDLRRMIDALCRSVDLPDDAPGDSVTALARRLNVSTKTIHRWRDEGLRWRWVRDAGETRRRLVFPAEAVERFTATRGDRVEKAARFTKLPEDQRGRMIERAGRLAARTGASLNRVAEHLARRSGRAVETVRLILEKHDRDNPGAPFFEDRLGPLSTAQRRVIARAYRMGVGVSRIAERYGRSRSTIYRAIHERRAAAARRIRLDHVHAPTFDRADADEVILRDDVAADGGDAPVMSTVPVDDLPATLRPLYRQPVIPDDRMRSLFVRFNYLKHKAAGIRDALDRYEPRSADLDRFSRCVEQAGVIRDRLVRANLPVVLSVARRHLVGRPDASDARLVELLERGNVTLIESIESHNAARGPAFGSYLTNKLLQQFATLESADEAHARARRRVSARDILRRLVDRAGESGVDLGAAE